MYYRVTEMSWTHNHSLDVGTRGKLVVRKDGNNDKSGVWEWKGKLKFQKGIANITDPVCKQNYFWGKIVGSC